MQTLWFTQRMPLCPIYIAFSFHSVKETVAEQCNVTVSIGWLEPIMSRACSLILVNL